ncbi:4Fe-4S binding protein [Chloroflexota bacterium]
MALRIDYDKCTGCGACQPACDLNNAIYESRIPNPEECEHCDVCIGMDCDFYAEGDVVFVIDSDRCTECIQDADSPKCIEVCPVSDCIAPDKYCSEAEEQLLQKRQKIRSA